MPAKKNVGYASYRLKPLQIITAEAKKIQAANKSIKWPDAIKKASAKYRSGSIANVPAKKAAPAKKVATKKAAPVKKAAKKKVSSKPIQAKLFGAKKPAGIQTKSRSHTDYNKPTVNIQIGSVNTLSPYIVHWFALIPQKGAVTSKDRLTVSKLLYGHKSYKFGNNKAIYDHARDQKAAVEKVLKLKGQLSKKYLGYIFTDKQFGLMSKTKPDIVLMPDGMGVHLTNYQKEHIILV